MKKIKVIERRYLYKARNLDEVSLVLDKVKFPSGREGLYPYLDCPYEVVFIVGIDKKGRIPLLKQHRYLVSKELLEIPAGSPKNNESLKEGAKREFEEECGFSIEALVKIGEFYSSVGITNQINHVFLGKVAKKCIARAEQDILVQWVFLDKAIKDVRSGLIKSVGSAYSILLADLWMKK